LGENGKEGEHLGLDEPRQEIGKRKTKGQELKSLRTSLGSLLIMHHAPVANRARYRPLPETLSRAPLTVRSRVSRSLASIVHHHPSISDARSDNRDSRSNIPFRQTATILIFFPPTPLPSPPLWAVWAFWSP